MRISDWSSDVCSSDLLKAYQDSYRSNTEEWDELTSKTAQYIILGLSSIPAVSAAVKGSRIPAALLGRAGIEGPSYIESQRDWNRANDYHIEQRLEQLDRGCVKLINPRYWKFRDRK